MYDPIANLKIQNKADALQYAINTTMQHKCGEGSKVDYEEAKKLFDFICVNVEFPEDSTKKMLGSIIPILEGALNARSFDLESVFNGVKEECS
jgi:hypothetical protein